MLAWGKKTGTTSIFHSLLHAEGCKSQRTSSAVIPPNLSQMLGWSSLINLIHFCHNQQSRNSSLFVCSAAKPESRVFGRESKFPFGDLLRLRLAQSDPVRSANSVWEQTFGTRPLAPIINPVSHPTPEWSHSGWDTSNIPKRCPCRLQRSFLKAKQQQERETGEIRERETPTCPLRAVRDPWARDALADLRVSTVLSDPWAFQLALGSIQGLQLLGVFGAFEVGQSLALSEQETKAEEQAGHSVLQPAKALGIKVSVWIHSGVNHVSHFFPARAK